MLHVWMLHVACCTPHVARCRLHICLQVTLWDNKSGPRGNKQLGFVRIVVEDLLSGSAHTKEWCVLAARRSTAHEAPCIAFD